MSKKLGNRVRILNVRIITNASRKDYEILEEIAKALDLEITDIAVNESVESVSGWKGSKNQLQMAKNLM